jgi:protein SCO1/2
MGNRRKMKRYNAVILSVFFTLIFFALPHSALPSMDAMMTETNRGRIEAERAVGRRIGDYILTNHDGRNFRLKELIGKPLILSFIYTNCAYICPAITTHLRDAIKEADKNFGDKFNVLTIGFDNENDTPQKMRIYNDNFSDGLKNWIFATGKREATEGLAGDIGFYYEKVKGGFNHQNFVTIVDIEGKVYKQVYGMDFKPHEILQPIGQLLSSAEKTPPKMASGIVDRIRLFCYVYDEESGTYRVNYIMLIIMIMGTGFLFITILLMFYLFLRNDIKKPFLKRHMPS